MRKSSGLWKALFWFALAWGVAGRAATWFVSPNGNDLSDGRSWVTALATIEEGLARASAGDALWLAEGYYVPRIVGGGVPPQASIRLKQGVSIYGGFAGTETALEQRERSDCDGNGVIELWEFTNASVVTRRPETAGPLLTIEGNGCDMVLDGVTLLGGRGEGEGGGAALRGSMTIRHCRIEGCEARNGGGMFLGDEVVVDTCLFRGNVADVDGGALVLAGRGALVVNCLFDGNGDAVRCRNGGAILSAGANTVIHCTLVRNAARSCGSALMAKAGGLALYATVFWGNPGHPQQVALAPECDVRGCAFPAGGGVGAFDPMSGNIILMPENAGPNGVDANDNTPGCHFPCFLDAVHGCFVPGGGSYLIGRGDGGPTALQPRADAAGNARQGYPDIGAYEGAGGVNLAYGLNCAGTAYCGDEVRLERQSDFSSTVSMTVTAASCEVLGGDLDQLIVRQMEPGMAYIRYELEGDDIMFNNTTRHEFSFEVKPRPLVIRPEECDWTPGTEAPRLNWALVSGTLLEGDAIAGELACDFTATGTDTLPITLGTLGIVPAEHAARYAIRLEPAAVHCQRDGLEIQLTDQTFVYDGAAVVPGYTTRPAGVPLQFFHVAQGDDAEQPGTPRLPGVYQLRARSADIRYSGSATATVVIAKAPLVCKADDLRRAYGEPNPPLTCTYSGFVGGDDAAGLATPPVGATEATSSSPARAGGYPIAFSGGADPRYEFHYEPGVLQITARPSEIGELAVTPMPYGDALEAVWILGYAVDPESGEEILGAFVWEEPDEVLDAGEWERSWRFVPETEGTYAELQGTATVTILKRPVTVAARNSVKAYGDDEPLLAWAVVDGSLAQGDTLYCELTRAPGEALGEYPIAYHGFRIARGERTVTANYEVSFRGTSFEVVPREITVVAEDASKIIGTLDPELRWRIDAGSLLEGDAYEGTLSRAPGEAIGQYAIGRGTLAFPEYYAVTFVPGTLTICGEGIAFAAADGGEGGPAVSAITYGTLLAGDAQLRGTLVSQLDGTPVDGHFEWLEEGALMPVGTHELGWRFVPVEEGRYAALEGVGTLVVARAPLEARASSTTREYGAENPVFAVALSGFVAGEDADALPELPRAFCSATVASPPGRYAIEVSAGDLGNYRLVTPDEAWLTVVPATPQVVDGGAGEDGGVVAVGTLTYGEKLEALSLAGQFATAAGLPIEGTLAWKNPRHCPQVATTEAEWVFTPLDSGCCAPLEGRTAIQVRPAPLDAAVADAVREYGAENPAFTVHYAGFVLGDTVDAVVTRPHPVCTAGKEARPGEYEITLAGGWCANYRFVYHPGTLTVTAAVPEASGAGAVSISGTLTYGQTLEHLTLSGSFTSHGQAVAGTLAWKEPLRRPHCAETTAAWRFEPESADFAAVEGVAEIQVSPAVLIVSADDLSCVYGEPVPTFTGTLRGFVAGEDESVLTQAPSYRCDAPSPLAAGRYAITPTGVSAADYRVEVRAGTLEVRPRPLEITPLPASKDYGETDPEDFDYDITAGTLLAGDVLAGRLGRNPGERPGAYEYTLGTLSVAGGNYALTLAGEARFRIRKVTPQLKRMSSPGLVYGQPNRELQENLSYRFEVPANGAEVPGTVRLLLAQPEQLHVPGTLTTAWEFMPEDPDCFEMVTGEYTFTVTAREVEVATADVTVCYGDPLPEIEWRIVSGSLVPGDEVRFEHTLAEDYAGLSCGDYDLVAVARVVDSPNWLGTASSLYRVTTRPATLTIEPRPLKVLATDAAKCYGQDDPARFDFTAVDARDGTALDEAQMRTVVRGGRLRRERGEAPGDYAIQRGTLLLDPNYRLAAFSPGVFRIGPRVVAPVFPELFLLPGEALPLVTVTARPEELVSPEDTVVSSAVVCELEARCGDYVLRLASDVTSNPNYRFDTAVTGVVHVGYPITLVDANADATKTLTPREGGTPMAFQHGRELYTDLAEALAATRWGGTVLLAPGDYGDGDGQITLSRNVTLSAAAAVYTEYAQEAVCRMLPECRLAAPATSFVAKGVRFLGGWDATAAPTARLAAAECVFEGEVALALRDFGRLELKDCAFEFGLCGLWFLEPHEEQLSHAQLEGLRFATSPEVLAEGAFHYIQCDNPWLNADTGLIPLPGAIFNGSSFATALDAFLIQTRYLRSINAAFQP